MRIIDDAFDMHGGYVLDFSDRTMANFFDDEFGITIYQEKYGFNGTSKAKHLRAFIAVENEHTVSQVLRRMWEYRESLPHYHAAENAALFKKICSTCFPELRVAEQFLEPMRLSGLHEMKRWRSWSPPSSATSPLTSPWLRLIGYTRTV